MGGIISPEPQVPNRGMEFISSHSNDSNADLDNVDDNIEDYISAKWRRCRTRTEALEEYQNDGTLPESADDHMIELREFLDDTRLLHPLGLYAKNGNNIAVLMCWVDIQGFKCIHKDADDYLLSTAQHIYHKYIKAGAVAEIDGIDDDFKDHVKETLVDATADLTDVHRRLFDSLQLKCFERIYHEIFVDFKKSASYQHVIADLKTNFNRIVPEDFDYMEKLGSGTYGIVLHVRKKSTGRHYAMKIQTKIGLLNCYHDALHRVDNEKQVLAACNHPFIISMDYAFQTRTTIMVVMDLGTSGTLLDALDSCEGNRMPEDRVRFYTAEIVLALSHLHRMGMIYRDLKPQNILLKEDGHIKLVDMGGVVDVSGRVLKNCDNLTDEAFLLFAPDKGVEASEGFGTSAKFNVSSNNLKFRDYNNDDSSCAGNGNSTRHGEGSSHRHAVSDNSSGNSGGRNGEDRDSTPSKPAPKLGMLNRTKSVMGTHGYMVWLHFCIGA